MAETQDPVLAESMRVSPDVQRERDQIRMRILHQEYVENPNDPALQAEIGNAIQREQSGNPWGGRGKQIAGELRGNKVIPAAFDLPGGATPVVTNAPQAAPQDAAVVQPALQKSGVTYGPPLTFDDAGAPVAPSGVTYGEPLFPDEPKPAAPPGSERGQFMRGLVGGIVSADPKMFGGFMQGMGTMAGWDWIKDKGKELQKYADANIAGNEPSVPSIANVRTDGVINALGDFFTKYLPYQAGNALASMAPTIVSGIAGAAAGGLIAGPPGAAAGGIAGTLISGYPMNYGDMYTDSMDDKGIQKAIKDGKLSEVDVARIVALAAVPITALDSWSVGQFGKALTSDARKILYKRVFDEMKQGGLREGTTEGLQQIISEAGQDLMGSDKTMKDHVIAVVDNAIGGLAGGVLTGGAAGAVQTEKAVPGGATGAPGAVVPPAAGAPAIGQPVQPNAPIQNPPATAPGAPPGAIAAPGEVAVPPAALPPIDQARADAAVIADGGTLEGADAVRLKNATLIGVYGENAAVRHVIDNPEQFSAIGDAMLAVAPQVEKVRTTLQNNQRSRDISTDILSAVDEIRKMKEGGLDLAQVMAEGATHDISFEGQQLLGFLDQNFNNPKALAGFMENYLHEVELATGVPSELRGRAFDIIQERENARKEKEATLQKERKDQAFEKAEAAAKRERAFTENAARQQVADNRLAEAVAVAEAAGSGVRPEAKTALEKAFASAKPLKGKQGEKLARPVTGSVQEAAAGSSQAGAGQDEAGGREGPVSGAAQAGEQGNARPIRQISDQPGAEAVNESAVVNRGAKIAEEVAGTRGNPIIVSKPRHLEQAAALAAVPTSAQAGAGNYQKGHFRFADSNPLSRLGIITIETPKGGTRVDKFGKWSVPDMPAHYGYLQVALGAEGDKADITIGDDLNAKNVYVIDQIDPETGKFDETKSFAAFSTEGAARKAYLKSFSDGSGKSRIGAITAMPALQFVALAQSGNLHKPVSYVNRGKIRQISDIPRHLDIRLPVQVESTGETVYVVKNAREAYKEATQKVERLESLRDCLRG